MTRRHARSYGCLLSAWVIAALASCAPARVGDGNERAAAGPGQADNRALTELEAEVARLRIERDRLAQANSLLQDELDLAHEDLKLVERQFVLVEERLRSDYEKASAVAAAAEARMRFDATQKAFPSLPDSTRKSITGLMETADTLIRKGNFPAGLFFAERANHTMISLERRAHFDGAGVTRIVSVSLANVRDGPGERYQVIEQVASGAAVQCVDSIREWYHVRTATGTMGWIHTSLLQ